MGLVSVLCATVLREHLGLGLGLIAVTIVSYGLMGALIYLRNIPSVIVTMGMSFVWVGIGYTLQPGGPGGQPPDWLVKLFNLHLIVPESVLIIIGGVVSSFGTVIGAITLSLVGALVGFLRLNSSWVTAVQGGLLIAILAFR